MNGFTFPRGWFYLYLAQDEATEPHEAQEYEGAGHHDPAARAQLDQALVEIEKQREHIAVGFEDGAVAVGTVGLAPGEFDERRHDDQPDQEREAERHCFEFWPRQREVVVACALDPGEQLSSKPP